MSEKKDPRINLLDQLKIRLKGHVYVGPSLSSDYKSPMPMYTFKCNIHGHVTDIPHGYKQRLDCPKCREERLYIKMVDELATEG